MGKLFVVGLGPGGRDLMTLRALEVIKKSDAVVGYKPYIEYIEDLLNGKEVFANSMRGELERCQRAIDYALAGKITSIVSTGDPGIYGMAGPILEMAPESLEVEVVPGVTSQHSAGAELGAPLMHDGANISLSDLLTSYDLIMERVEAAASSDMLISLYNPRSMGRQKHLPQALEIIGRYREGSTPVGIVRDSGRPGTQILITSLDQVDVELMDMKTMVIIGNSKTFIRGGKMITPRGYEL